MQKHAIFHAVDGIPKKGNYTIYNKDTNEH